MQIRVVDEDIKEPVTENTACRSTDEKTIIPRMDYRETFTTDGPFVETKEYFG